MDNVKDPSENMQLSMIRHKEYLNQKWKTNHVINCSSSGLKMMDYIWSTHGPETSAVNQTETQRNNQKKTKTHKNLLVRIDTGFKMVRTILPPRSQDRSNQLM